MLKARVGGVVDDLAMRVASRGVGGTGKAVPMHDDGTTNDRVGRGGRGVRAYSRSIYPAYVPSPTRIPTIIT